MVPAPPGSQGLGRRLRSAAWPVTRQKHLVRDFLVPAQVGSRLTGGRTELVPVVVWREDGGPEAFWGAEDLRWNPPRGDPPAGGETAPRVAPLTGVCLVGFPVGTRAPPSSGVPLAVLPGKVVDDPKEDPAPNSHEVKDEKGGLL